VNRSELAHTAPVLALKGVAWRWFHQSRTARRLLLAYRWPRFRDRAFDIAHLSFFDEESASGPLQRDEALMLHALVRVLRPKVVVEFGFLGGHSALNFLTALPPGSRLYSFDIDAGSEAAALRFFGGRDDFRFRRKSQADITATDVDGGPIDLVFLDASHDLELNRQTFERLQDLLSEDAVVVVHDTGTWSPPHMTRLHRDYASAEPGWWVSEEEYAHQPDEREFVNWVREAHPRFAQVNLHTRRALRHGMTVLQRSSALTVPRTDITAPDRALAPASGRGPAAG
jgi:predicted O-methyltransferase YrrM